MRRTAMNHSPQTYKSMSSAMWAAKKAVGSKVGVINPRIGQAFDAHLIITEDMLGVSPCEGGWHWTFSYGQDDVTPYTPWDDNVPSGEECASTPASETPPGEVISLPELTDRIEFYKKSVKSIAASKGSKAATAYINRELPQLKAACATFGVTMSDVGEVLVMVQNAANSTDPSLIAKVMLKAEPYGLHCRLERQLSMQASKRGLSATYCMQSARDHLQHCTV